ncbi:hypothetical protein HRG_009988 [Hirsutella rhossiliensis]|uniref:Uncharacterized protein n=1 Tax=Hirsutella rhossiliensis TaxID=111463 RepID=A0A9P8MNW2_9HYPO|nr:uncharacterized protein HRG_09988 [Hirsutella rhossiliensis]KAH0958943.1 hypothetical protein HRG_09988 [Hirsutella rhossiliensis]
MTRIYPSECEILVVVGNDDTIDSMWEKLQDLLRVKGMENTYAEKERRTEEDWIKIGLADSYSPPNPMPEPCKEIRHYLKKLGYKEGLNTSGGFRFDP